MALQLSPAQEADAIILGQADLRYLFDKEQVSIKTQALFYHVGVTSNAKLSAFASSVADLKDVMKADFGMDTAASIAMRVQVANVVVAYQAATARTSKLAEIDGELEARHLPKPLPTTDYLQMRIAWHAKYWELEDKDTPARAYLERRADLLEQGELTAEPITEMANRDEEDPDAMVPTWDISGTVKMKRGGCVVPEPTNPEQLRKRLTLMGTGLMMLGLRHPNRQYLQNLNPQIFQSYLDYLLGDYVWNLTGKSAEGYTVAGASWEQLLVYEHKMRKVAWQAVSTGKGEFGKCLVDATKDAVTKERFFTTPIALSAASKHHQPVQHPSSSAPRPSTGKGGKGNGKGNSSHMRSSPYDTGKGKSGKGKGGGKSMVCAAKSPDGKAICYNFNNAKVKCRRKQCSFLHICGRCFGKHPLYMCENGGAPPPRDTSGGGQGSQ